MRKSLLLIAAALVVLCFTQCTKQRPSNPYMGKKTGNISFTASPSGGDSRNHFTDLMNGGLDFTWDEGDKLYVYCSPDGDFESNGYYSGPIDIVSGVGEVGAKFSGKITYDDIAGAKLRFFYFGSGVSKETPGNGISVDFSSQNGDNETVSDKLIAMLECSVNKNMSISDYGGTLEVQFAIVKVAFKGFNEDDNMNVQGLSHTGINVSGKGVISYNSGNTSNLGKPTFKTAGVFSEPYYAVFMDEDDGLETDAKNPHQFYDAQGSSNKMLGELKKGIFYTKKGTSDGSPVEIVAGKEDVILGQGGHQGDGQ